MKQKIKIYIDILMVLFAFFALCISLRSCVVADKANKNSEEAIEVSQKQFIQINRPYIALDPVKFDNKTYLKVIQENDTVYCTFKYIIKNVGNVLAKDIKLPPNAIFHSEINVANNAKLNYHNLSDKTILGPGQNHFIELTSMFKLENKEQAIIYAKSLLNSKKPVMDLKLSVKYSNELDSSYLYKIENKYSFSLKKAILLKSESEIINIKEKE
jgi:hypothetical protein